MCCLIGYSGKFTGVLENGLLPVIFELLQVLQLVDEKCVFVMTKRSHSDVMHDGKDKLQIAIFDPVLKRQDVSSFSEFYSGYLVRFFGGIDSTSAP